MGGYTNVTHCKDCSRKKMAIRSEAKMKKNLLGPGVLDEKLWPLNEADLYFRFKPIKKEKKTI